MSNILHNIYFKIIYVYLGSIWFMFKRLKYTLKLKIKIKTACQLCNIFLT